MPLSFAEPPTSSAKSNWGPVEVGDRKGRGEQGKKTRATVSKLKHGGKKKQTIKISADDLSTAARAKFAQDAESLRRIDHLTNCINNTSTWSHGTVETPWTRSHPHKTQPRRIHKKHKARGAGSLGGFLCFIFPLETGAWCRQKEKEKKAERSSLALRLPRVSLSYDLRRTETGEILSHNTSVFLC